MCGIAGIYGFKNDDLIKRFSRDLSHRGPDGEGIFHNEQVTLLNRRLAIIDVSGGNQPMYNEDKSIALVFVGEIYNYKELTEELKKKGHVFTTESDTEVLVHGYEEWGTDYFDRCNGMFTVAIYDKNKEMLVLARDHFGIKPLYYALVKQGSGKNEKNELIFSSEIKPLINSGLIDKKPNDRTIYRYLRFRVHDDERDTFFEGVSRLMPGEVLTLSAKGMHLQSFTTLQDDLKALSEKKPQKADVNKFRDLFIDSVRLRLMSEVPVGTCLSGGLDSSAIVAVIQKLLQNHVKEADSLGKVQQTFSAVFPGSTNNEEGYIQTLLDNLKTVKSHKIYPKPEEFFKEIYDFVKTQEEPTISTGPYAQYKVMEEVGKHVTVVIDGQGADEMMAGYIPYYFVYLRQLLKQRKYGVFIKELFSSIDILYIYIIMKIQGGLGKRHAADVIRMINPVYISKYTEEKVDIIHDNLKLRLIHDIFYNSIPSLLRYEDRNSMKYSVEGRVPFLDFRLLRYLFSMPDTAIINNGWNKRILRDAVKSMLPARIARRRSKIGFTNPEYDWFMRMKNKIYAIYLSDSFASRPYFNQTEVLKAFNEFVEGKTDDTLVFWRVLNIELWLRIFFDESTQEVHPTKPQNVPYSANEGKNIEIHIHNKTYLRFPVRTELFKKDDDYTKLIQTYIDQFHTYAKTHTILKQHIGKDWFIVLSEKVIAISQGRSYFIWDIKPGLFARVLSKKVTRTPHGIGLGSPWTMQLAIEEVGLPRLLLASAAAALTKPFGIKGLFYRIAGREAAGIDGPTEYSLYPSNVSAKLLPKNPETVSAEIHEQLNKHLPEEYKKHFKGVVIIDANDLGRNVIGNSTGIEDTLVEEIFGDNPMGQSDEQTPLVITFLP